MPVILALLIVLVLTVIFIFALVKYKNRLPVPDYYENWTASRRHLTIAQRTISIHLAKINFWNNQNL